MKKFISLLLVLSLLCGAALAEIVYVTVSDGDGAFDLAYTATEVTDADGDGALTIYDALYCAHEAYFEGGAEAGFAAEDQGYGPSLTKLWGIDNGGSFGYYLNNESANSLADTITEGAHVQAYAYQDLESWSDQFCYFEIVDQDPDTATYTIVLNGRGYDADWNVVISPIAGATITVGGEDSGLITDAEGKVQLGIDEPGVYVISATSEEAVLVPPVLVIEK